jgi:hypothetical protein
VPSREDDVAQARTRARSTAAGASIEPQRVLRHATASSRRNVLVPIDAAYGARVAKRIGRAARRVDASFRRFVDGIRSGSLTRRRKGSVIVRDPTRDGGVGRARTGSGRSPTFAARRCRASGHRVCRLPARSSDLPKHVLRRSRDVPRGAPAGVLRPPTSHGSTGLKPPLGESVPAALVPSQR